MKQLILDECYLCGFELSVFGFDKSISNPYPIAPNFWCNLSPIHCTIFGARFGLKFWYFGARLEMILGYLFLQQVFVGAAA